MFLGEAKPRSKVFPRPMLALCGPKATVATELTIVVLMSQYKRNKSTIVPQQPFVRMLDGPCAIMGPEKLFVDVRVDHPNTISLPGKDTATLELQD